jgi:hypothetical protein
MINLRVKCQLSLFPVLAVMSTAQAVVIYSDDFSGSAPADLNGTVPDIRPGSETWLAGSGATAWRADGSVAGGGDANAFLPFSPESGKTYTLSVDANPTSPVDSSNWFALGFSETTSVGGGFYNSINATGWMLLRVNRGVQTFLGFNTTSGVTHSTAGTGVVKLEVVLDTTESAWTVEWFVDNTSIRSVSYTANPTINYVTFGRLFDASGTVDNFSLSVSAVPEPASYALVLGGVVTGVIALRRRRQARLEPAR